MTRRQLKVFPYALILMAVAILLLSTACGGEDDYLDGSVQQDERSEEQAAKDEAKAEAKAASLPAITGGIMQKIYQEQSRGESYIFRFYDTELDVYCWMTYGDRAISCLPGNDLGYDRTINRGPR